MKLERTYVLTFRGKQGMNLINAPLLVVDLNEALLALLDIGIIQLNVTKRMPATQ